MLAEPFSSDERQAEERPWVAQVELRDRLLDVNKDLMEMISQM
ncbi:hypothetical protein [Fundidesulfovibrio terrae]|nr:hypothetical protein [Fundidesulfovibrio terrae]